MLPTGRDKSLLFIILAYLNNPEVIIVVAPFQVLVDNLIKQLKESKINYIKWQHRERNLAAVIIVSTDIMASTSFLSYTQSVQQQGLL